MDIEKERRRWRIWQIITGIGRIFRVGTILRTDSGLWPSISDEVPMVELEKLAQEGLKESAIGPRLNSKAIERAMTLFASVSRIDGSISDEEMNTVRRFVRESGPEGLTDSEQDLLVSRFAIGEPNFMQLRNDLFLLKKEINLQQAKMLTRTMFRLAYFGGFEAKENSGITDIAQRLGLDNADIRLIGSEIRRIVEKKGDSQDV